MHWDSLTIKLAITLSVTSEKKGYEAVRKWLPFPSWRLVQECGNMNTSADPVDMAQLERCWNEIKTFVEENENYYASDDESDDIHYADSDSENDSTTVPKPKAARQIFQFFLISLDGDFSWPVASFPVYSVTAEKLNKHMIWPLIKALDIVSNSNIKVVFGVCDGGPRNSNFFKTSSKKKNTTGKTE